MVLPKPAQAPLAARHQRGEKLSAIVFCIKKDTCLEVAALLCGKGIRAEAYHGKLPDPTRAEVQRRWQQYETPVVVATVAFGMGIDNPKVRRGALPPRSSRTRACTELASSLPPTPRRTLLAVTSLRRRPGTAPPP